MMLNPLAQIGIGVLMPVCIRPSELVVDVLGHRKRCQREQEQRKAEREGMPRPQQ
jgi:hypothetical protein